MLTLLKYDKGLTTAPAWLSLYLFLSSCFLVIEDKTEVVWSFYVTSRRVSSWPIFGCGFSFLLFCFHISVFLLLSFSLWLRFIFSCNLEKHIQVIIKGVTANTSQIGFFASKLPLFSVVGHWRNHHSLKYCNAFQTQNSNVILMK